jgi:hypothetical protein
VWTAAGLSVGPVTWTDQNDPTQAAPHGGQSEIQTPRSLGLRVSRPTAHVDILLHSNGSAEVAVLQPDGEAVVHTTVQLESIPAFGQLLDRVVELITWSGVPKDDAHHQPERAAHWVVGYDGERWSNEA